MAVIAEFTVSSEDFPFGEAVGKVEGAEVRLERVVPTEDQYLPYIWVEGADFDEFERIVRDNPNVNGLTRLDQVDDSVLYRIVWTETEHGLVNAVRESRGAVMEASGDETWRFKLRFPDNERLTEFYDDCTRNGIELTLEQLYAPTQVGPGGSRLTGKQREALVLALQRGYFDSPRTATLAELADELGISKQALSQRIRQGNAKVLRELLLTTAVDADGWFDDG